MNKILNEGYLCYFVPKACHKFFLGVKNEELIFYGSWKIEYNLKLDST